MRKYFTCKKCSNSIVCFYSKCLNLKRKFCSPFAFFVVLLFFMCFVLVKMPEGSQESNQHGILASMDVDQSSDAKKENGTSLALTSVLENLRNQMGGVSRSELCLRVIKINVTKGVKSYVFVNAVNDDGYCVELAAYDDIAVKKLKETAKQSGVSLI